MTAVEQWQPARSEVVHLQGDPTENLVSWARAAQAANDLAIPLCQTSFVPAHFQGKPGEATAAILYGAEAGLSPLQALQGVYVISGKPAMYARTLMAVVLAAGHEVWTESESDTRVIVCGRRRGSDQIERAIWTIDRAKKAGYTRNSKYQTDPQAMLLARAQSDVCRRVAPDALLGMAYSVEELQDSDEDAPAPVKRTVRRQTPAAVESAPPATAKPASDSAGSRVKKQGKGATTGPTAAGLPPLPGEEEDDPNDRPIEDVHLPEPASPPAPDRPGFITRAQLKMLHVMLGKAGLGDDRDAALAFYAKHNGGRVVESSKDLTRIEATRVIDALVAQADDSEQEPGFDDDPAPDEFYELPYKDD